MTNDELDARIRACADQVRKICEDLDSIELLPSEQMIALGALLGCTTVLTMLCTEPPPSDELERQHQESLRETINQLVLEGMLVPVKEGESHG